ncbi:MAG: DDE-type integrase/transposase/recombinase [Planctomycetes bacterium]|nr:DDE-type integrase/transposase/recombinase [Planctomycetota bacterium]
MNDESRQKIALFRYSILAPLISGTYDNASSNKGFFRDAAKRTYTNPSGADTTLSTTTIERWYYSYQRDGFDGLIPKRRNDTGRSRKLDEDMMEQINYLKKEYPRIPATLIHQKLLSNGTIIKGTVSLSTINRYVNQLNYENRYTNNKDMRRYERPHINEVWCGDSSVGPYLMVDGKKHKVWIIAMMDDASRMITGIDLFFNDNTVNVMSVLKSAVSKFGRPRRLNFDNGSSYKNKQITLLSARIGTTLNYNPPYTPTGKAKIERFFLTLKQQWMSQLNMNDFSTLDMLRSSLMTYIQLYNQREHSSLNGASPMDRFFSESEIIKRLSSEQIEKSFLLEIERRVSADNVIVVDGVEYEVHYRYSKLRITLRYSPDMETIFIVDKHSGELTPIRLLNKHENSKIKREKVQLTGGEN